MITRKQIATSAFAVLMLGAPAFAQSQIDNNQPVQGDLHAREATLQSRLTAAFDGGLIDSTELSAMQRDLDGILTRESDFKTRPSGLTSGGRDSIEKSLDLFEARLDRHSAKTAATKDDTNTAVLGTPVTQSTVPAAAAPVTVIETAPAAVPVAVPVPVPATTTVTETTEKIVPVLPSTDVVKQTTTTIESNDMAR